MAIVIRKQEVFPHAVEHWWQEDHVLGCVFKQLHRQRPGGVVPAAGVVAHDRADSLLTRVLNLVSEVLK